MIGLFLGGSSSKSDFSLLANTAHQLINKLCDGTKGGAYNQAGPESQFNVGPSLLCCCSSLLGTLGDVQDCWARYGHSQDDNFALARHCLG